MKKLSCYLCGLALGIVMWLVLVMGQAGSRLPSSLWVDGVYDVKNVRAQAVTQPKMVFIGGSSLLFGLDSDLLERIVARPVVNMGVNAGLPLQMIVGRGITSLHSGDIAVFVLEYPLFSENRDFTAGHIDFLLSHPDELASYPLTDRVKVILSASWNRVWQGYLGLPEGFNLALSLYGPHNVDSYGDQINSHRDQRQPWMDQAIEENGLKHYGRDFVEHARGMRFISAVTRKLQARNICVLFLPPSMLWRDAYQNDPVERAFYESFPDRLADAGLTLLATPYDFMYPHEDFFDTPFHLIDEARTAHTKRVGEILQRSLETHCNNQGY
jgi:hypothetical protein